MKKALSDEAIAIILDRSFELRLKKLNKPLTKEEIIELQRIVEWEDKMGYIHHPEIDPKVTEALKILRKALK